MEIITLVVTTLIGIIGWFIQRNINQIEENIKDIKSKVYKLEDKTNNHLSSIDKKLDSMEHDTNGIIKVISQMHLKTDKIQENVTNLKLNYASSNIGRVNETHGKVIVLEERLNTHEKAIKLAGQLINKLTKEGGKQ